MPLSCHSALNKIKGETDYTFALAGNPNVGKSTLFNRLTGMGVVTANYPGKTVEVNLGVTTFAGKKIGIVDLPGTYAIGAVSEDQWVARQAVLDGKPDVVVVIIDATNLTRNLYIALQFLDLGFPLVIALNLIDQAEKSGIKIDTLELSKYLGVPVVPTVAIRGQGLDKLMEKAIEVARRRKKYKPPRYGHDVERLLEILSQEIELFIKELSLPRDMCRHRYRWGGREEKILPPIKKEFFNQKLLHQLPPRAIAILLFERDPEFIEAFRASPTGKKILRKAEKLIEEMEGKHGESSLTRLVRERYGLAGSIVTHVQSIEKKPKIRRDLLWRYTTMPFSGIPLLIITLIFIFYVLFSLGGFLANSFAFLWGRYVSPILVNFAQLVFGETIFSRIFLWGFDAGVEAALEVGIPYVLTFYLILAFLEDTGYLNSIAFLTDRVMHKIGLHGRAIIPLVAGGGCNVPAIIGTRVLTTMRERIIASTLIVLIPCSARTAVIIGGMSKYGGWLPAIGIYLIDLFLVILVGLGLNRIMPGQSTGLVMEMFPFRLPSLPLIVKKTWFRFKDFIFVATPIVLAGSFLLGFLYESGYIWTVSSPLSPLVKGWLGLPPVAGLTLIFAVLRKELALQLLVTLAIVKYGHQANDLLYFMNVKQIFIYSLVNTIYIPCLATIAVLSRELGWKKALLISLFTVSLALFIGGIINRIPLDF